MWLSYGRCDAEFRINCTVLVNIRMLTPFKGYLVLRNKSSYTVASRNYMFSFTFVYLL